MNINAGIADEINSIIEDFVLQEKRVLSTQVLRKVVKRTPYLTGQAKKNWVVTENAHQSTFYRVSPKSPIPIGTAETNAIEAGQRVIRGAGVYTTLYIQNNAPYIVRLNNGYSLQAPALYVDYAILEAVR